MNLRNLSARIVSRVLKEGQSLTAALEQSLGTIESANDKAFVQALCYGVIREFYRLDFLLGQLLNKPIKDDEIKALALIGLYQLEYMRVKAHAAVSETVSAAPRKKPWAKPLLNAIMRNYQRRRDELQSLADNDPVAASNHPQWLIDTIGSNWPEQAGHLLAENNLQAPMTLRVNSARIGRTEYKEQLAAAQLGAIETSEYPSALILERPVPVEQLPGFSEGLVSVQDLAAQLSAELLDLKPNQRVLDVCAAPGGKSAHILEMQANLSGLTAIDIDANRMQKVRDTLRRLRLDAECIVADASQPNDWWDGVPYDRILLDAPCSALGVIRRHPDIKLLRKPGDIAPLQQLQQKILEAVWPLLAPGGLLIYATCSILKEENELQIQRFLNHHQDATEWPIDCNWGMARPQGRQILTGSQAMDGFYYARIRKH
ncbi:16S rRNA (cytosine(967)-C(5))-methyltransferase RsmB [Methylotuvimicrobium alcaliphilum]|uniref:16S rRNA (cytosine(967)-C(5))-methyltransferase n=1 Tax=Methylotuvimicrobium alcaliphilum (strain DSM 19304 / NCIMB 14124 / VKM B-2133 / 20Z) TaxID=1091494 RepID=G4SUE3_META2|nr:16S rRNA (cytosine(967)-C(5))-methyltransferase RsmB [Methylotuvimicrobium alcaliphilum]CCE25092.1 Ribosomal RNA small subunit methyltransferase B [Methylotuvimicrobium alcaliphilum 20Z]